MIGEKLHLGRDDLLNYANPDVIGGEIGQLFASEPYADVLGLIEFERAFRPQFVVDALRQTLIEKLAELDHLETERDELVSRLVVIDERRQIILGEPTKRSSHEQNSDWQDYINQYGPEGADIYQVISRGDEPVSLEFTLPIKDEHLMYDGNPGRIIEDRFGERAAKILSRAKNALIRGLNYEDFYSDNEQTDEQSGKRKKELGIEELIFDDKNQLTLRVYDRVKFVEWALGLTNFGNKSAIVLLALSELQKNRK